MVSTRSLATTHSVTSTGSPSSPETPTRMISNTGRPTEISNRAASRVLGIRARWISIQLIGQWPPTSSRCCQPSGPAVGEYDPDPFAARGWIQEVVT